MRRFIIAISWVFAPVLLVTASASHADSFEAPAEVMARADGSFSFNCTFRKGPGSDFIASAGWLAEVNVTPGGLIGDCFCLCPIDEGVSFTLQVDGQLVDPDRTGRVSEWVNLCAAAGQNDTTVIRPFSSAAVEWPHPEGELRFWNEPNPFPTHTTFHYTLPEPGPVDLRIYDISGRLVAKVVDEVQSAGDHLASWDVPVGPSFQRTRGVLFARLTVRGLVRARPLILAH